MLIKRKKKTTDAKDLYSANMVTLYIYNLNRNTNASRIHREFEAFGKLTNVFVPMELVEKKKKNKGYGFVTFLDRASAEEAISKMDGRKLDGRVVKVNESKPRG